MFRALSLPFFIVFRLFFLLQHVFLLNHGKCLTRCVLFGCLRFFGTFFPVTSYWFTIFLSFSCFFGTFFCLPGFLSLISIFSTYFMRCLHWTFIILADFMCHCSLCFFGNLWLCASTLLSKVFHFVAILSNGILINSSHSTRTIFQNFNFPHQIPSVPDWYNFDKVDRGSLELPKPTSCPSTFHINWHCSILCENVARNSTLKLFAKRVFR